MFQHLTMEEINQRSKKEGEISSISALLDEALSLEMHDEKHLPQELKTSLGIA